MDRIAIVLLATALAIALAALAAVAAAVLARRDGATYPTAINRAATTFVASLTLAAVFATVLAQYLLNLNP